MAASLIIDNLSKTYPAAKLPALDKLSLSVQPGEVYGFLGANGAGKSTTIRMLLNFIQPTGGSAQIMGQDIARDSVALKKHVGYLAGDVALWPKVTGQELFNYLGQLQGGLDQAYLTSLIKRFEAEPHKKIEELSKGNRQKIGVIQALMHQPDVLIMDEPTSGLDPLMQEVFYAVVREAAERGAAVFVSSHNLAEAQRLCDRVGIIKRGRLVREQDVKTDESLAAATFRVVLKNAADISRLRSSKSVIIKSHQNNVLVLKPSKSLREALAALSQVDVESLTSEQLNLEDEFLEYYGDGA